jgi:hypothetical protein
MKTIYILITNKINDNNNIEKTSFLLFVFITDGTGMLLYAL